MSLIILCIIQTLRKRYHKGFKEVGRYVPEIWKFILGQFIWIPNFHILNMTLQKFVPLI